MATTFIASALCLLCFGALGIGAASVVVVMRWSRGRSLALLALLLPVVWLVSGFPAWAIARRLPLDWGHAGWNFVGPYLLTGALSYPVIIAVTAKWLPPPSLKQSNGHPPL